MAKLPSLTQASNPHTDCPVSLQARTSCRLMLAYDGGLPWGGVAACAVADAADESYAMRQTSIRYI